MRAALVAVAALVALSAPPALAAPQIHAHRGGSVVAGIPTYPENTMPAFRNAAREGYVLELDVKLTGDNVPVVFHDPELERVTPCTGLVRERTFAAVAGCKVDVLGSPGGSLTFRPVAPREPIPTLASVLAFAKAEGAFLNLEIKNVPTDADFDPTNAFASRVMDVVLASKLPADRLIVQSFWPQNLAVAKGRLPGVQTSLLTLAAMNDGGPAFAAANGYQWVSPAWPVDADWFEQARSLGRRTVPYTLNRPDDVREAARLGADGIISDDPFMVADTLGLTRDKLARDLFRPTVRLKAPRYASQNSRTRRFRIRWRGRDRGSGIARYRLEARRSGNSSNRWRVVRDATPLSRAIFKGRPGRTYTFRIRARDRFGNLSRFAYGRTSVPRDDRSRNIDYSRGWRRMRSRGAWGRTLTRGPGAGLRARLVFRGNRVALIGRVSSVAGRVEVRVGRRRKVVSLRRRKGRRARRVVFRSRPLRPGVHVLRLRTLGGGPVDLDAIGISEGAAPPKR